MWQLDSRHILHYTNEKSKIRNSKFLSFPICFEENMFPPFEQSAAFEECKKMISLLDAGFLELKCDSEPQNRSRRGVMLGVLLATDFDGKTWILKTVSGLRNSLALCDGISDPNSIYVEPIVDSKTIDAALLKNDFEIHQLTNEINALKKNNEQTKTLARLKEKRKNLTNESLNKVRQLYAFFCADGKMRPLKEICKKNPPTGIGDCCAPKLLHYAFNFNLTPRSMAEVFYSFIPNDSLHGKLFSPCDSRCALILPAMLGLEIVYRDSSIVVVNKPSGLLSVPGRGADKQDCVVNRLKRLFPDCIAQPAVHRLDMETSGLMVLAFTKESHRKLCAQFASGAVKKKYVALLDGDFQKKQISPCGTMNLFFRLDVENRPHQIWDAENGKLSITNWKIIRLETYRPINKKKRTVTRVEFFPQTGRTHQLRLAAADKHGFGIPIVGDSLYGKCDDGERLFLHAEEITFLHPTDERIMHFTAKCPF